jgi:NDP-4-keto-2,6-dideoxyhexose 3-C-methyltransferase
MNLILKDVAESGRALGHLQPDDLILDIGGNDGTLLSFFKDDPYTLLNIDPAKNVTSLFDAPRYARVAGYFGEKLFRSSAQKNAKLIFSIAMFYHLHDPVQFSREIASCLDDDGVWIIQMAYLPAMIRTNMYDNIVHEHACYYAANHMKWVMEQVGLEVFDVMLNDVYGGSFRIFVKKKGNPRFPATPRYQQILEDELREGLFDPATYEAFEKRLEKTRDDLCALCKQIHDEGKTIWVYGASTKGNTILQYCGIGGDLIVAAADSNSFKIGKFMIGSDIPIRSEMEMRAAKPDYLLALPYSFLDGFRTREAALVSAGTKFIVPLPDVRVV